MRAVPPPRYRVVEQGRRLVVIDRWADAARPPRMPASTVPAPPAISPGPGPRPMPGQVAALLAPPRRTRFDGSATLTTHPLYDGAGPRTIALDPGAAGAVKAARIGLAIAALGLVVLAILAPAALIVLLVLGRNLHKPLRRRITAWLDTVAREGS